MPLLPPAYLWVIPNPYSHLDHLGRPAGIFPRDPSLHVAQEYVGAQVDVDRTTMGPELRPGELRSQQQDTVWKFATDPQKVEDNAYYRRGVAEGALIAADTTSARRCGVNFVPLIPALEAARTKAIAHHVATYGSAPPAFDAPDADESKELAS